jgi:hypothetical protein
VVVAVIDDHRLLSLLTAPEPPHGRYATTCSWWWRLTSAFAGSRSGALTRRIDGLDHALSSALRQTLRALPAHLEVVDLRRIMSAMGVLAEGHPVNVLAAEAIAAAAYLETSIEVEIDAPHLGYAAHASGIEYRVVSPE